MTQPAALLVRGQVMHERMRPVQHRFVYPVFYVKVNLSRLAQIRSRWFGIDKLRVVSLRLRDYGPRDGSDLAEWMRALLRSSGIPADGDIWLQTFPRLFGFVFNPVSFWYCHDRAGVLRAVLAEVNNTFGESHRYLLHAQVAIDGKLDLVVAKTMHVSPFCQTTGTYRFRFTDDAARATSLVQLDYDDGQGVLIKTAVGGRVETLTDRRLLGALWRQPWQALGIVAGIHWQAGKLWLKGVGWYAKPAPPDSFLTDSGKQKEGTTS